METTNLLNTLHDIRDRCFVYSIMLTESASSLGKLKIIFKMPAIFISIVLSVINSSKLNETDEINIINTVFNAFIALLIGVENTLQIDNKKQVFTSTKNKFEKLLSTIEKRLLDTSEPISIEFVQNIINEYEQVDDDLTFDIPKSIQDKAKKNFTGVRTLPLILGGEKVQHTLEMTQLTAQTGTQQISQPQKQPQQQLQEVPLQQLQQQLPQSASISQVPQVQQLAQQVPLLASVTQVPQVQQLAQQIPQVLQVQQVQQVQQFQQVPQVPQTLEQIKEQDEVIDIDTIINTVL